MQKPCFRSQIDWWYGYVETDGRRTQVKLAKGQGSEADAWAALRELEKGNKAVRTPMRVAEAFEEFRWR